MSNGWGDDFDASPITQNVLHWAREFGASTLGEAYDLLEQFAVSNDVPEVLGHDGTIDEVREELDLGLELLGPDALIDVVL